jgi:methylated-DNA-[protein]-cysteine S-methyltransferase
MKTYTSTVHSPIGELLLVSGGESLCGIYMEAHNPAPRLTDPVTDDGGVFPVVVEQLEEWFAGTRTEFDLPITTSGTEFQDAVWAELRRIPYGETTTYGDIAAAVGRPTSSRAVGAAVGRNPVSIVIPCHRVMGASGAITGYAGGVDRKRYLLDHERRTATATAHR